MKSSILATLLSVSAVTSAFAAEPISGVYVNTTSSIDVLKLSDTRAKITAVP